MRANGVADLAWLGALRLADRFDDDVRRRQRACFLGQSAAENLHEMVIHFLAAELGEQSPHLSDVLVVAATLFGALLEHRGSARWSTGTTHRRPTHARCTHTWPSWSGTHRATWPRPTWTAGSIAHGSAGGGRREVGFHLAPAATPARPGTTTRTPTLAAKLVTAVFAAGRSATTIAVELTIRVQVVSFQVTIY
jgi:hypothetical protein